MSDRTLISTRKGLFFVRGGRVEHAAFLGENVTLACVTPDGIYAALNLGHFGVKLRHSADGGRTWDERAAPAYPEGETLTTGDGKPPQPANLKLIWSLEASGPTLWAGTLPGGLFRSDDGGRSWALVRGLWDRPERPQWFGGGYDTPGIHSLCFDPRDPDVVLAAVSCGGVWRSGDRGATWELVGDGLIADYMPPEMRGTLAVQDPHRMGRCAAAPDRLWIQHHNGVFRSDDGGRRWERIESAGPSVFGFAVAVHPARPDTAWFVPAVKDETRVPVGGRFVVTRTRDAGRSFDVLTGGLPEASSYDLVYRHALAADAAGERLAMGSTTGGVWHSDDQGDKWAMLPERLPPVHAVCFG
ncbi:MAG: WD40/YVTN/BNR-like repeat-containing protein [Gemmataceae bacterium]